MDEGALRSLPTVGPTEAMSADLNDSGQKVQTVGGMRWDAQSGEWVRCGNLAQLVALKSQARTATAATGILTNSHWSKLHMRLAITTNPGAGKYLTVSVFDGSGAVVVRFPTVEASRAFQMAPGLEVDTPGNAQDALRENAVLPAEFQIQVIPSDGASWTYELTYDLLI